MDSKILVIGAGGIGCELLKNLVLTGFSNITIVDLDTIELSNLNRQFLFRSSHIGKWKADVAAEAIKELFLLNHPNKTENIISHHFDISDHRRFPLSFWTSHSLVLNALDNVEARRYVSQKCNSLQIPLVESGTSGYLGQCSVHIKDLTECWECIPKEPAKTYPTCTIRNTPTKPIHCIIWAKEYLYPLIFNESSHSQTDNDNDNGDKRSFDKKNLNELSKLSNEEHSKELFKFLFISEIERISSYEELWTFSPFKPKPLCFVDNQLNVPLLRDIDDHNAQYSINDLISLFINCVKSLRNRESFLPFDKDDDVVMKFIYFSSLLRAQVYGIEGILNKMSLFDCKSIAGNIIPAIATTNAIVAGMIVCQAISIIKDLSKKNTFLCHNIRDAKYLWAREDPLDSHPNPLCTTCQVDRVLIWLKEIENLKLKDLLMLIRSCHPSLSSEDAQLSIIHRDKIIYDEEDVPLGLEMTLVELGINDSSQLFIDQLDKENKVPALIITIGVDVDHLHPSISSPLPKDQLERYLLMKDSHGDDGSDDGSGDGDDDDEYPLSKKAKIEEIVIY